MRAERERAQGQGLTEYIGLVGLIAVLLVGAVGWFKFRVDEAYDGSKGALSRRVTGRLASSPSSRSAPPRGPGFQKTVTDASGRQWDVYLRGGRRVATPEGTQPSSGSPDYQPSVHGS